MKNERGTRRFGGKPKPREARLLVYLLVLSGVAAWKFVPRPWHPTTTLKTSHHIIYSTAAPQQTQDTARALALLYDAYSNRVGGLPQFQRSHPLLKLKLFKDRNEFRAVIPNLGWAEALYRYPYCLAYFSANEVNPYHWMLHESVHQLNHQVAQFKLEKWLEEGMAAYFSTSRLQSNVLAVGSIDPNTYPVWWIYELATTEDLAEDIRNESVIPLRAIITNQGGPSLNGHFNSYYLHWWTLTHFIFENPRHRDRGLELLTRGGTLEAFEQLIGPVDQVQAEWLAYVRKLKADLAGDNFKLRKPAKPQEQTNGAIQPHDALNF